MIEIKNLGKVFTEKSGKVVALRNASVTINDGDIFGVIGMSGAGKSTLLRCLCLLEKPSEGQILLNGRDLAALSGADLRSARRQMVFCRKTASCAPPKERSRTRMSRMRLLSFYCKVSSKTHR